MKGSLIGEKLVHSFSKEIHTSFGVDYSLTELRKDEVESFVKNTSLDYFNVTIPYKKLVIPYLDCIDSASQKIGAVNTVVNKNGKKYGYNTDYYGFKALLEKNNILVKDKNILILGTGGTKETVTAVVTDLGAKSIKVVSRKGEINYSNCYFSNVNVIINTTPVGMYPNLEYPQIDLTKYPNLTAVVDCIYNPLKTKLILQAESLGLNCCGGLYMLVAQAVYAYKLVDDSLNINIIDKIYNELLFSKQNIVLVGMPSCGKSTIGKILSEKLNKEFIDTDQLIVEKYGDIPSIFTNFGEKVFRDYEKEIIERVSKLNNKVIATGGGAVLNKENIISLKHNSIIIYIDRDLDLLETIGRPLSKDKNALIEMKKIREPIYSSCCNFTIKNCGDIETTIKEIIKELKK